MRCSTLLHLIVVGAAIAAPIDHVNQRSHALESPSSRSATQDNTLSWSPDITLLSTDPPAQQQPNLRREITTQQSTPSSFPSSEAYQDPSKLAKLVPRSPFRGMAGKFMGAMKPKTPRPSGGIIQRMRGNTQSAPPSIRSGSSGGLSRSNAMRRPTSAQSAPPTHSSNKQSMDWKTLTEIPARKPVPPPRKSPPGSDAPPNFNFDSQPKLEPSSGRLPNLDTSRKKGPSRFIEHVT
jgi:hypothetical protein